MAQLFPLKKIILITLPLAALIAVSSIVGILFEDIYSREASEYAAQGVGQDLINLIILVPILLAATIFIRNGSKISLFVWLGAMIYTVYSYTTYCFGVHFNALFLVYCGILGLSFYLLIVYLISMNPEAVKLTQL